MTDKTIFAHLTMNKRDDEPTLQQLHAYAESMSADLRHTENVFKVLTKPFSGAAENVQTIIKVLVDRVEQMSEIACVFSAAFDIYCERLEQHEKAQPPIDETMN